jgi:hypothetical protein
MRQHQDPQPQLSTRDSALYEMDPESKGKEPESKREGEGGERERKRDLAKLLLVGGEVGGELLDAQVVHGRRRFRRRCAAQPSTRFGSCRAAPPPHNSRGRLFRMGLAPEAHTQNGL